MHPVQYAVYSYHGAWNDVEQHCPCGRAVYAAPPGHQMQQNMCSYGRWFAGTMTGLHVDWRRPCRAGSGAFYHRELSIPSSHLQPHPT